MTGPAPGEEVVAVLVRPERIVEGLRTAGALPLSDNEIEVILLADSLPDTEDIALQLDTLDLSDIPLLATFVDPRVSTVPAADLADRLRRYKHVLSF